MKFRRIANLTALMLTSTGLQFALVTYSFSFTRVMPLNDVLLYGYWLQLMQSGQPIFGLAQPGVYPFPALLPMLAAQFLGGSAGIVWGWVALTSLLSLFAIAAVTDFGKSRSGQLAAWFWVGSIAALGPVAIGRIDAIAALLAIFGISLLAKNRLSAAISFFTLGAWIKIWPVALAVATFASNKSKRKIAVAASSVVASVFLAAIFLGGNSNVLSFVFQQSARGIQIESPAAIPWLWLAKAGVSNVGIYFDQEMITNQVFGGPIGLVGTFLSLLMVTAIGITFLVTWRAFNSGLDSKKLFAVSALAMTLDLIAFNKVGSPQFMIWLAAPVIAGILFEVPNWKVAVVGSLTLGFVTQLVYPIFYIDLMSLGDISVTLLTIRNVLLIALTVWANLAITKLPNRLGV